MAVVTGGGRGLGRAFAQALAAAGCAVAVVARSAAELAETVALIERSGGQARTFLADVTDAGVVGKAFAEIEQSLGPVDLLVNNAGILGPLGPFAHSSIEDWWRTIDVNLRGQILCAHQVLPGMIARRRGRIVNIASGGGATMLPHFSAYVTSKSALIRFAECLAAEVKPHGLAVFTMSPGTVRTAMTEHSLQSPEGKTWLPCFREIFDAGRDLPPERPAALLLALASGKADVLSGCFLHPQDDLDRVIEAAAEVETGKLYSLRVRRLQSALGQKFQSRLPRRHWLLSTLTGDWRTWSVGFPSCIDEYLSLPIRRTAANGLSRQRLGSPLGEEIYALRQPAFSADLQSGADAAPVR